MSKSETIDNLSKKIASIIHAVVLFLIFYMGTEFQFDVDITRNHNTQEQCEYEHQAKCVNAWIKESMQNPKSKGVDNE